MEIEIDAAKWTGTIVLAENDRDLLVQGNSVTQLGSAVFVRFDGLVEQREQRGGEFFGRFIDANDVFFVNLYGFGNLWAKCFDSHRFILETSMPKGKLKNVFIGN